MLPRRRVAISLALSVLGGACSDASGVAAPSFPADAVLGVESMPITAADVDRWRGTIELVETRATLPALRRFALTNIVLPRTVTALIDPPQREAALTRARDAREALASGVDVAELETVPGTWKDLGLDVWGRSLELEPGVWSEVFETAGAFVVFRVVERPETVNGATAVTIERVFYPYLEPEAARDLVESSFDAMKLWIVDPAWSSLVPEHYKFRMAAEAVPAPNSP